MKEKKSILVNMSSSMKNKLKMMALNKSIESDTQVTMTHLIIEAIQEKYKFKN